MGVRWLTTYVKEVERSISSVVELETKDINGSDDHPTFVVDGWAFIFKIWLDLFGDSIRSLDYDQYKNVVESFIESWLSVGIKVVFVFDGPFLPSKLPAIVKRRAVAAGCNNGFMHSSPQSRMSKALQLESNIIPALIYSATVDVCRSMKSKGVQAIFSPTEADSLVAETAADIGNAYALSQDSDFFILCSRGKGCLGYVPLDSMEYVSNTGEISYDQKTSSAPTNNSNEDQEEGFQQVSSRRRKGANRGMKALADALPGTSSSKRTADYPPLDEKLHGKFSCLRFRSFSSQTLAAHLELPPSLLPLFAAVVGNDYTTSIQTELFLRNIEGSKRIPVVANALRVEWLRVQNEVKANSSGNFRRGSSQTSRLAMTSSMHESDDGRSDYGSSATATPTRNAPGAQSKSLTPSNTQPRDPVRSLVETVVVKLLAQQEAGYRYPRVVASGERELIIDSIIDSAATYSILTHSDAPHLASPSAAFFGEALSLLAAHRKENDRIVSPKSISLYREAYQAGLFREYLVEILTQRIFISRHLPEDPEQPSIQTRAGRELRLWIYAILFEVWGMSWARKRWEEPIVEERDTEAEEGSEVNGGIAEKEFFFRPDRTYKEGERPDDVISVDTESSSSEIGVEELEEEEDDDLDRLPTRPGSVLEEREEDKPAPGVVEYVRSGNLYAQHLVRVVPLIDLLRLGNQDGADQSNGNRHISLPPSLANLLAQHEASQSVSNETRHISNGERAPKSDPVPGPIVLMPLNVRLDLFLHAHNAYTSATHALPKRFWLSISVLRFLISSEFDRLQSSNRTRQNWSKAEIQIAIKSMLAHFIMTKKERQLTTEKVKSILPSTRAIHLASSIQLILDLSNALAQSLLLPSSLNEKEKDQWPEPHSCFFGPIFYIGMSRIHNDQEAEQNEEELEKSQETSLSLIESVENAVLNGLETCLGTDASDIKKERKAKRREAREAKQQQQQTAQSNGNNINLSSSSSTKSKPNAARNAFAALLQNDN